MRRTPVLLALAAILALSGCGGPVQPDDESPPQPNTPAAAASDGPSDPTTATPSTVAPTEGSWTIVAVRVAGAETRLPGRVSGRRAPRLEVTQGRITVFDGCNTQSARLRVTATGWERAGRTITTLVGCRSPWLRDYQNAVGTLLGGGTITLADTMDGLVASRGNAALVLRPAD